MIIRVLLVDDEENTLDALENLLRIKCKDWYVRTVLGGINALKVLDKESFDVVVIDLEMPVVDGADLLIVAKKNHPKMARIILSGRVGGVEYEKKCLLLTQC